MKYFVTGASGFIGKALVAKLTSEDHEVEEFVGDIRDAEEIQSVVQNFNPEIVIHLAAQKKRSANTKDFAEIIDVNLKGTFNLLDALKATSDVKKIIILGTAEEYGLNETPFIPGMREDPISFYSFSKMSATHLSQLFYKLYNLPIIILRPSIAYGPGQSPDMFLPSLITALKSGQNFEMTTGEQKRQFIYIDDLIDALGIVVNKANPAGQIINITNQQQFSIKDVAKLIAQKLDKVGLLDIGKVPTRIKEIQNYQLDTSYLNQSLGWSPKFNFEQGVEEILKTYK